MLGRGHEELCVDRASVLLPILLADDYIIVNVITLSTDNKLDGVDMCVIINLVRPMTQLVEALVVVHRVDHDDDGSLLIVKLGEASVLLGTCRVPYL